MAGRPVKPSSVTSIRLTDQSRDYLRYVAALLRVSQQQIVEEALRQHRAYLVRAGVLEDSDERSSL